MANFPGPGSIILRGRGKSIIDPGSEDDSFAKSINTIGLKISAISIDIIKNYNA